MTLKSNSLDLTVFLHRSLTVRIMTASLGRQNQIIFYYTKKLVEVYGVFIKSKSPLLINYVQDSSECDSLPRFIA